MSRSALLHDRPRPASALFAYAHLLAGVTYSTRDARGGRGRRMAVVGDGVRVEGGGSMDDLIVAVAERGDQAAFRALFDHFAPRLKAFVRQQGADPEIAEEVVQETMVNVWRRAKQFEPARASASTWIYAIARNARIDLLRKARRPAPDPNDPAMVPDPEPPAHQVMSSAQDAARLKRIVDSLPPDQRDVLRLAFYEEKAHSEVAADLGIPLGTVKSRIRLAFGRLRAELGEDR